MTKGPLVLCLYALLSPFPVASCPLVQPPIHLAIRRMNTQGHLVQTSSSIRNIYAVSAPVFWLWNLLISVHALWSIARSFWKVSVVFSSHHPWSLEMPKSLQQLHNLEVLVMADFSCYRYKYWKSDSCLVYRNLQIVNVGPTRIFLGQIMSVKSTFSCRTIVVCEYFIPFCYY